MWKILGALLWGFTVHSNALGLNSSLLESKVFASLGHKRHIYHILTENEFDYVVSVGEIVRHKGKQFIHQFFGTMLTPRYGFTYLNEDLLEWVKEIKSYVNDMRRPLNVDELKPIIRYISLRDFISDEPKERWSLSIGIAVMELAKNVKYFTEYLISPIRVTNVNYMVGYNMLQSWCIPPPDKYFVKIEVARVDESEIPRRYNGVDFWVRTISPGTKVQEIDIGSLVFFDEKIVGIIMEFRNGYGMVKCISSDDISKAKNRCEKNE